MDSTQQRAERALERARQGTVASLLSLPGTAVGGRESEGARAPSATMRSAVASEGAPVSVRLPPSPPYALSARELRPRWQGARAENHTQPPPQSHSRARVQPRGLFSAGTDDAAGAVPRISPQRGSPSSGSPSGTAARRWPALSSEGRARGGVLRRARPAPLHQSQPGLAVAALQRHPTQPPRSGSHVHALLSRSPTDDATSVLRELVRTSQRQREQTAEQRLRLRPAPPQNMERSNPRGARRSLFWATSVDEDERSNLRVMRPPGVRQPQHHAPRGESAASVEGSVALQTRLRRLRAAQESSMHELRALRAEQLGLRRRQLSALAVLLNAERAEHRAAITSAATVTGDTGVDPQVQHQRSRQLALIDRCAAGGARTLGCARARVRLRLSGSEDMIMDADAPPCRSPVGPKAWSRCSRMLWSNASTPQQRLRVPRRSRATPATWRRSRAHSSPLSGQSTRLALRRPRRMRPQLASPKRPSRHFPWSWCRPALPPRPAHHRPGRTMASPRPARRRTPAPSVWRSSSPASSCAGCPRADTRATSAAWTSGSRSARSARYVERRSRQCGRRRT